MANGRTIGTEIINGGDGNDRLSRSKALNSLEINGGNGNDIINYKL